MHPVWQCEDIRYLLYNSLQRRDLVQLARTCKELFDSATNELWKTVPSFSPLLALLPADARRRSLRLEDIQRLDFYASKIKTLCLENKTPGERHASTQLPPEYNPARKANKTGSDGKLWVALWSEIGELRPVTEFLPNLHHLRFVHASEALLVPLVGISGAHLQQIYIKSVQKLEPESVVRQFLEQLRETPKLGYIFVQDGEQLIPPRLIHQAPLKTLRLDPRNLKPGEGEQIHLPPELFDNPMSGLEHLTLGLTSGWYTPELDEFLERKYLPGLKSLWLNLLDISPQPCTPECSDKVSGRESRWVCTHQLTDGTLDQSKRSPATFLDGLDSPSLELLRINFPQEASGQLVLDVVQAAKNSCELKNLTELALSGGNSILGNPNWRHNHGRLAYVDWWESGQFVSTSNRRRLDLEDPTFRARHAHVSAIHPTELREALTVLLPLPHLTTLQLTVAPSFLGDIDLEHYKIITDGLPALTSLSIGHVFSFRSDRIFLDPLAAFCSMLPNLRDLKLGTLDNEYQETPNIEWLCPSIKSLNIAHWYKHTPRNNRAPNLLYFALGTYFPSTEWIRYTPKDSLVYL